MNSARQLIEQCLPQRGGWTIIEQNTTQNYSNLTSSSRCYLCSTELRFYGTSGFEIINLSHNSEDFAQWVELRTFLTDISSSVSPPFVFDCLPLNTILHSLSSDFNFALLCLVQGTTFQILPKQNDYIFSTPSDPLRGCWRRRKARTWEPLTSFFCLPLLFLFLHISVFPILFYKIKGVSGDKVYWLQYYGTNYCLWKSYPAFKKRTTDEAPILDQHTHLIR